MRVFAIFGVIEYPDNETAYIFKTEHSGFYSEEKAADEARNLDMDYIIPHYFAGRIVFTKYHKETT